MNLLLLLILFVVIAIYFRQAVPNYSISAATGFVCGFVYFTILPVLVLFLYGKLPGIRGTLISGVSWARDGEMLSALIFMGVLCIGGFIVCLKVFPANALGRFDSIISTCRVSVPLPVTALAYVSLSFIIFFATGLGAEDAHWAESKNKFMGDMGILGSMLMIIPATLRYVVLMKVLPSLFQKNSKLSWLILTASLLCDLYTTGTRFFLFQVILVVVFDRLRTRDFRPLMIVLIAAMPLAGIMEVYTVARTHFSRWDDYSANSALKALENGVSEASDRLQSERFFEATAVNITESASLGIFKYCFETFGDRRPFLLGATLVKPVVAWIPRSVWEDKPANFTWIVGRELVREGVSVNSTSIGEFYGNFGILGGTLPCLVMLVYVYIFSLVSKRSSPEYPYLVFVFGIAASRNGFMESALPMLMAALLLNILSPKFPPIERTSPRALNEFGPPQ